MIFHKKSLERGDFQEPKTDMKQMNCYQRNLASKPLSNYYKVFKIFTFEINNSHCFQLSFACFVKKILKNQTF